MHFARERWAGRPSPARISIPHPRGFKVQDSEKNLKWMRCVVKSQRIDKAIPRVTDGLCSMNHGMKTGNKPRFVSILLFPRARKCVAQNRLIPQKTEEMGFSCEVSHQRSRQYGIQYVLHTSTATVQQFLYLAPYSNDRMVITVYY